MLVTRILTNSRSTLPNLSVTQVISLFNCAYWLYQYIFKAGSSLIFSIRRVALYIGLTDKTKTRQKLVNFLVLMFNVVNVSGQS